MENIEENLKMPEETQIKNHENGEQKEVIEEASPKVDEPVILPPSVTMCAQPDSLSTV